MRVLQVSATNSFAENRHITTTASSRNNLLSTELSAISTETFGNNNENDRTHPSLKSNLNHFTNNSRTTTATSSLSSAPPSSHQQNSNSNSNLHNNFKTSPTITTETGTETATTNPTTTSTTTTTTTTLEQFNYDGSLIDSTKTNSNGTSLKEHQNNFINETTALEVVDSLQNVDSSNYSFFEDCVNEFANLESYRRTSGHTTENTFHGQILDKSKSTVQKEENPFLRSGHSTPSFEEINLDNHALERELNRIIRGTSMSEACEDDNSCNCKSLQESLKSYELIRGTSSSGLARNDDNASLDGGDDDYDDDQMDPHHNAGSITRSSDIDPDDDSLMDDDDEEYLSSQASSCTSVSTPQRSHFPRGIINPNYPGFQHLAHTLSEHYISHQSSDPYDSDLSEYEMELSVDSFECDFLDGGSSSLGNNINHNNNNNLNSVMVINNNLLEHKIIAMDDSEDNFNGKSSTMGDVEGLTVLPLINITQSFSDTNRNASTDDKESSSLQTYLKLYDSTTQQQENDERSKNLEIEIPQEDGNYGCPTPDILIKNFDSERYCRRVKPENRPDLLRNVSPNPPMKCRFEAAFMDDEDKRLQRSTDRDSPPTTLCTENKSDTGRDDISLGLTPVDIVGDFGQEVEREFGLIVSGYNSRLEFDSFPTGAFYLYNVAETEKMSDAQLSNGTEDIPISKYTTDVVDLMDLKIHHRLPTDDEADTSTSNRSNRDTRMEIASDNEDHRRVSERLISQSGHISENSINSRLSTQDTTCDPPNGARDGDEEDDDALSPEEKIIPTAIVKPKYQKSSYDERQLPPIGLDFSLKSRAWFDCPSSSSKANTSRNTKKSAQNTERNSKIYKSAKFARGNSNNPSASSSSVNRFGLPGRRMGNNNNSKGKIAVVQPMLKDTEEHQMDNEEEDKFIDNKPIEPHCTRYSFASWAASLRDSKRSHARAEEAGGAVETSVYKTIACFDVYNIETALPEIDLDAIETHLKRANEEERRRRNDREEIRRRLAMGAEDDYFSKLVTNNVRPGRKPSLQSRLKNGKNLQICFTNEASSDTESHSSDSETCPKLSRMVARNTRTEAPKFFSSIDVPDHPYNANPLSVSCTNNNAKKSTQKANVPQTDDADDKECDFFTKQARLQIEARMALSQAKDMAHMQMELDRQKQRLSPITGIIRGSLEKVGVIMAPEKRRVSRQMLTDMNIAQLQIIVNDLHTQIEDLNDSLVHYLMERDELHMGQDSMLVDIEDISRFLSAKELEDER